MRSASKTDVQDIPGPAPSIAPTRVTAARHTADGTARTSQHSAAGTWATRTIVPPDYDHRLPSSAWPSGYCLGAGGKGQPGGRTEDRPAGPGPGVERQTCTGVRQAGSTVTSGPLAATACNCWWSGAYTAHPATASDRRRSHAATVITHAYTVQEGSRNTEST